VISNGQITMDKCSPQSCVLHLQSRVFLVQDGILVPLVRESIIDFVTLDDAKENLEVIHLLSCMSVAGGLSLLQSLSAS